MRDINKILESLSPEKRALLEKKLKEKAENYNAFPLSYQQKRLWFLDQLEPGSLSYNIPLAIRLIGNLDSEKVIDAIKEIVNRHEILRSNIVVINENPIITINKGFNLKYKITDLSNLSDAEAEKELKLILSNNSKYYFHLNKDQLFLVHLIKLKDEEHVLQVVMHHIISDGWSLGIFTKEFQEIYSALTKNKAPNLEDLRIQYTDYSKWQNKWSESDKFKKQLNYWKKIFKDLPPKLNLPTNFKRNKLSANAGFAKIELKHDEVNKIKSFLNSRKITGFIFFISALKILLHKVCRENDISIGTPIANRNKKEIENLIGFFVNTLVLRTNVDADKSFEEILNAEKQNILETFDNQDLPFEYLVESLNPERDMETTPLFQVMFVYQNIGDNQLSIDDIKIEPIEQGNDSVKFDLTFNISESKEEYTLSAQYNKNKFSDSIIKTLLISFNELIRNVLDDPNQKIRNIALFSEINDSNLSIIRSRKSYTPTLRLEELFEQNVEKYGTKIALKGNSVSLTYKELDDASNKLANKLVILGIKPNDLVGIHLERDVNVIIAILAIFKIGAAYLPLDPIYPSDRINYMIEDSGVTFIISQATLSNNLNVFDNIIDIESVLSDNNLSFEFDNKIEKSIKDAAYVIYTSGSTGKPKGTIVTQYNVLRLFESCNELYSFNSNDVWTLFHSYAFDFSVWEIWGALLFGGKLIIVPQNISRQPDEFYKICKQEKVTVLNQTPTAFTQFIEVESNLPKENLISTLRYVIFGGEALKFSSLIPWINNHELGCPELINMYGITETTVHVTFKKILKEEILTDVGSNIGKPLPDLEVYIVDDGLNPLPKGIAGEICVSGGGVANGYLNREELTMEKFKENHLDNNVSTKLYRSGDLGFINENDELVYLGRIDKQIQLRGFRIELGEIEDTLNRIEPIVNSVVTPYFEQNEIKFLVAYLISSHEINDDEIKKILSSTLPEYMIPNIFIVVDEIPLTENGKVDYKKLPEPTINRNTQKEIILPNTETEKLLVKIWSELLSVDRISINDNFFNLGGHSLLATKMVARIKNQFDITVPLRLVFDNPVLRDFAIAIDRIMKSSIKSEELYIKKNKSNIAPLSFAQQRLWFIDKIEPRSPLYNIPSAFRVRGELNLEMMEKSLNTIIQRHSILRTTFDLDDDQPVQKIHEAVKIRIKNIDVSDKNYRDNDEEIDKIVREELNIGFDLKELPLFKVSIIELGKNEFILICTIHHIISDGWSSQILITEFLTIYNSLVKNHNVSLPELEIQYADYSKWQREYYKGDILKINKDFWKSYLEYAPTYLKLPTDFKRPEIQTYNGDIYYSKIDLNITQKTNAICNNFNISPFMLYYSIFSMLIYRLTNQSEIVIGTPVANRERVELQNLIGLFVNSIPIRTSIDESIKFSDLLKHNKQSILDAFEYKEYPFEKIIEVSGVERNPSYSPLFQVMFTYNSLENNNIDIQDISFEEYKFSSVSSKFDLSVTLQENNDHSLTIAYEYNTDLFKCETIQKWDSYFSKIINEITKDVDKRLTEYSLTNREIFTNRPIHNYKIDFISQIRKLANEYPDKICLVYSDNKLTYKELINSINSFSKKLKSNGVKEGDFVGIYLDRSIEYVISMFSILNIGAAFVPIDKKYPKERVKYIYDDLSLRYFVSFDNEFDDTVKKIEPVFDTDNFIDIKQNYVDDLIAYVIYTSGTTGKPKGVMINNESLNMFINSAVIDYGLQFNDKILQFSSLGFDTCIEEIFPILFCGGTVYLRTEDILSGNQSLIDYVEVNQISILDLPTAYWKQLVSEMISLDLSFPDSLKTIIIGGEKASIETFNAFKNSYSKNIRLLNTYGPTETTVVASYWEYPSKTPDYFQELPIGKNLSSCTLYVLDDNLNHVPFGIIGRLYVSGKALSIGYYNKQAETASKFIPNPFSQELGERMYDTGDLVRIMSDGNIEFIGRADRQVKVRGFRIETEEIENSIQKFNEVNECVVIQRDFNGKESLICFYTSENEYDNEFFKKKLIQYLPEYMVPVNFVKLDKIPLNTHGKVDFNKLKSIELKFVEVNKEIIPPTTKKEKIIYEIWSEIFNSTDFGITDNFFELGGDSIIGIQFISKLRHHGYELNPVDLFKYQTIKELGLILKDSKVTIEDQGIIKAKYSAIPIQRLFIDRQFKNPNHWNQSLLFRSSKHLDVDLLKKVISLVLKHHDALRTKYIGDYELEISDSYSIDEIFAYYKYENNESDVDKFIEKICNELQRSLDLTNGPITKVGYFELESESRLFITVHHIAIDGVSWRLLLEDIQSAYESLSNNNEIQLPPKTTPFNKWAEEIIKFANSKLIEGDIAYWQHIAEYDIEDLTPENNGINSEESTSIYNVTLSNDLTEEVLRETLNKYSAQINEILLTALIKSYSIWKGKRKLFINLEGHGRESILKNVDVSRTVGWFTSIYPVLLDLKKSVSIPDSIKTIKEEIRNIPNNGFSFGIIRYFNNDKELCNKLKKFDDLAITFNYLGQVNTSQEQESLFTFAKENKGIERDLNNMRDSILSITSTMIDNKLNITFAFSANQFDEASIKQFGDTYLNELKSIIKYREQSNIEKSAADFSMANLDNKKLNNVLSKLKKK